MKEWKEYRLGDVAKIYRGGSPRPIEDYITTNVDGVNWIKIGDVAPNSKYINTTAEKIKSIGVNHSRQVRKGDFILSNSMSFGRPYILNLDGCIHDGWLVIQDYQDTFDKEFLYYILSSADVVSQYVLMASGSSVQNLNKEKVENVIVNAPSTKEEQTRIASALSEVDALLASLDKLIAKKQAIKEGTMQQLLTGKTRLNAFTSEWKGAKEWKEYNLGKIGITYSGLTGKTKNDFGIGSAHYISFLNVLNNPIVDIKSFEMVNVGNGEKQNRALKGDLFFNTSSETPEEVGICAMLNDSIDDLYLNSFCFGYRVLSKDVYPLYLSYFFRSKQGRLLMSSLAQGVTRYNISKKAFNEKSILLPPLEEQQAIASILTSMDSELSALQAKRKKYEAIKQGMMQQLLTGKIRLI